MGIAYSNQPIFEGSVSGSSSATLRAGLDAILTAAGWESTEVSGGYRYALTSPQGLTAACLIRDLGASSVGMPCLTIQFASADLVRLGREHLLGILSGREYDVWAGKSQLFISLPGYSSTTPDTKWEHALCGGIPYVPLAFTGDCAEGRRQPDVTEAWWSSGVASGDYSFRWGWYHTGSTWSACHNGVLISTGAAGVRLRLAAVSHPLPDFGIFLSMQQTQRFDGTALYLDPLLIWGSPAGRVRGQIWDAVLGSKDADLDHEISFEGLTWRNWMHYQGSMTHGAPGSYYSSLYLLSHSGGSNYAY